jgi:hypothetical protein
MFPFKKFNFFIGANNSGKSTALNFISKYLPLIYPPGYGESLQPTILPLERHMGAQGQPISFGIAISEREFIKNVLSSSPKIKANSNEDLLNTAVQLISLNGAVWLKSILPLAALQLERVVAPDDAIKAMETRAWQSLWHGTTGQTGGSFHHHWLSETLASLAKKQPVALPSSILIPAIRQIGPTGQGAFNPSGVGLIDRLAEIQSPDHDRRDDRLLFEKINNFLKSVTDVDDAQIEIPHNRTHVLVHMNERVLPLSSLGTGIHEVIMLAAACVLNDKKLVCIEEPEIHLHPILQRKFIRFLDRETKSQYFIATHSASFIDTPGAAIFHVQNDRTKTSIRESILRSDRHSICVDLGHRASDIVQSNAVIWVEGPSERIYLKHWLSAFNAGLIEGVHYSIMFYGGRLLSHLGAEDREVQAFIDLRMLNQNLVIVMDSDKESAEAPINSTKQRIITEFAGKKGIAWLTTGREIENYVEYGLLQRGLAEIHPDLYDEPGNNGQFDHAFLFRTKEKRSQPSGPPSRVYKKADKVKLARWVCSKPANLDVLDLRERIAAVASLIEKAND